VNYATERWAESALRRAPADFDPDYYSLEFPLSSGKGRWIGNFDVYLWHRANGSNCVASALMALEKWLYDEIDAEDRSTSGLNRFCAALSRLHSLDYSSLSL